MYRVLSRQSILLSTVVSGIVSPVVKPSGRSTRQRSEELRHFKQSSGERKTKEARRDSHLGTPPEVVAVPPPWKSRGKNRDQKPFSDRYA
ncbi:hypothetical protein B296_00044350 [Ensete ventricosum]|uniref:Uncharacterized protein n=1 Tax=Ensete ventricosum TaxID=4639 RepID=A0A426YFQ7_ENSVE|nr:hypothetical protein B296_00044350 [Ensete ventricosum]